MNERTGPWVTAINARLRWTLRVLGTFRRIHLIYLGLLPSLATFVTLRVYGYPLKFLLFICGIAAVAIYLAVLYSYAPLPQTLPASLWVLVDGPLFALAARWGDRAVAALLCHRGVSGGWPRHMAGDFVAVAGLAAPHA